ncbi:MAG: AraC family transcriptional regulator [Pseudomonadota bacterium]
MPQSKTESFEGLERSCTTAQDGRLIRGPDFPGLERLDARFAGTFFAPHRHDTYAVGLTLSGVQTFFYRGRQRTSLPGQILVLHPDEMHDGAAASEEDLHYRMLYLDPLLVRETMDRAGTSLPFVAEPVVKDPAFRRIVATGLDGLSEHMEDVLADEIVAGITRCLLRHAGRAPKPLGAIHTDGATRARDYLCETAPKNVTSHALERVSGLDRYSLSRHFRALFGTSPHRFLTMRRLDMARQRIETGMPLAEAAFAAGFSDQAHMTRHFKKAFGVTPGVWARASVRTVVGSGRHKTGF